MRMGAKRRDGKLACPSCSAPTERREGPEGPFLGCSRWPECRRAVRLPDPVRARALLDGFVTRLPEHALAPLARKLARLLDSRPEDTALLVLGRRTPSGRPTFEAILRGRLGATCGTASRNGGAKRLGWQDRAPTDPRAGIRERETEEEWLRSGSDLVRIVDVPAVGAATVPSSEYPHHRLAHPTLNPVQSAALPYVGRDVNVLVASSTSSGKTLTAEMFIGDGLMRGGKGIYLSPLRAVTQEKHDDWTAPEHPWSARRVAISTGDYVLTEARREEVRRADVVALTTESLDARTRRMRTERNDFLLATTDVVVDELHLLTMPGRGDALEAGLMRFTRQNPRARLVMLSATLPNVEELARWATKLNGKPTVVVRSAWRPTKLTVHWVGYHDRGQYREVEDNKRATALRLVLEHPDDRFICFVHSKETGRRLLEDLRRHRTSAEFHSADLGRDDRLALERRFREGDLRVVVATSTLAYGVNMPARRVVVVGVHRGMQEVDPIDVVQECGRAGRVGLDPEGDAYVLVPGSRLSAFRARYSEARPIRSTLNDEDVLAFHLTAEVAEGWVRTEADAAAWHARSFAAHTGEAIEERSKLPAIPPPGDPSRETVLRERARILGEMGEGAAERLGICAAAVLGRLVKSGILQRDEVEHDHGTSVDPADAEALSAGCAACLTGPLPARYSATSLGRVSSWLYFSPFDVADWCSNFRRLVELDLLRDDDALAWALATRSTAFKQGWHPREVDLELARIHERLREKGVPANRLPGAVVAVRHLLAGVENRAVVALQREVARDAERISQALALVDRHVLRGLGAQYPELLAVRLRHGVGWREADLCRLPGIGAKKAAALLRVGVGSVREVVEKERIVVETLGRRTAEVAVRGAKGLLRETSGRSA